MKLIRINSTSPLYPGTEKIWKSSFPHCERRSCPAQREVVDNDGRLFYNAIIQEGSSHNAIIQEGSSHNANIQVIGILSWWMLDGMVYGEHFAMSPSVRGHGLGERVFREVTKGFLSQGLPFVFEVESPSPENPITLRRIDFYQRCGMHILYYPYFQPPYHKEDSAVPMLLMSSAPSVNPEQAAKLIRSVYPKF